MKDTDRLDALLRTALTEEETPPPEVQAALIRQIRNHRAEWNMPWWLPAAIGGLQTVVLVAATHLLLPDSLFSYLAMLAGAALILSAGVLSGLARKKWTRKERENICGG